MSETRKLSPLPVDERVKVLEALRTVALRFEKDVGKLGYHEIALLLGTARTAAEENLRNLSDDSSPAP